MWTNKQFWLDSSWRAFRTFCQALAAMLGGQAVNLLSAPWSSYLGVAGTAGLVSLLMSVDRERAVVWTASTAAEQPATVLPLQADYASGCGTELR